MRQIDGGKMLMFECPGCGVNHGVAISGPGVPHPYWEWNGSLTAPTLMPSILCKGVEEMSDDELDEYPKTHVLPERKPYVCRSFIVDGAIRFLDDCAHKLAGKVVQLPDIEVHA